MTARRGNPKTRRRHAYATVIHMLLTEEGNEWISQWAVVERCNNDASATRKEYSEKEIGNYMRTPIKHGFVEKRRVRVGQGYSQTQYRFTPVEDWNQVEISRAPNLETWAGLMTEIAGITLTT